MIRTQYRINRGLVTPIPKYHCFNQLFRISNGLIHTKIQIRSIFAPKFLLNRIFVYQVTSLMQTFKFCLFSRQNLNGIQFSNIEEISWHKNSNSVNIRAKILIDSHFWISRHLAYTEIQMLSIIAQKFEFNYSFEYQSACPLRTFFNSLYFRAQNLNCGVSKGRPSIITSYWHVCQSITVWWKLIRRLAVD